MRFELVFVPGLVAALASCGSDPPPGGHGFAPAADVAKDSGTGDADDPGLVPVQDGSDAADPAPDPPDPGASDQSGQDYAAPPDPGGPDDPGEPLDSGPDDPGNDGGGAPDADVEPPPPPEPWTLIVLPDTQYYSLSHPWVFDAQTEWIAANAKALNIRFVVHEGDITDQNTDEEWVNARASIDTLVDAKIPFALVPGNHDYAGNAKNRSTLMNAYFSMEDYAANEEVGVYEAGKVENTAHTLTVGGQKYLFVMLEFGPRHDVAEWASEVIAAHPGHLVVVVTHAFVYHDETRYDWWGKAGIQTHNPHAYGVADQPGGANDGEELWQKVIAKHPNVLLVLNGHVLGDGLGHVVSKGNAGNVVHQLLANYQTGTTGAKPAGGGGYLRVMTFQPDGSVDVSTYSPALDESLEDPANELIITFDPSDYDFLAECSPGRVSTCSCEGAGLGMKKCDADGGFSACECVGPTEYAYIVIDDDPKNKTLSPCDPGPIESPGADIDAAELLDGDGEVVARLADCALVELAGCGNDNADATKAHGKPDAPGNEAAGGYVSLNGGTLTCAWTGAAVAAKGAGMAIKIYEIGGSVENYRFKLCKDLLGTCLLVTGYGTGVQTVPVDSLF